MSTESCSFSDDTTILEIHENSPKEDVAEWLIARDVFEKWEKKQALVFVRKHGLNGRALMQLRKEDIAEMNLPKGLERLFVNALGNLEGSAVFLSTSELPVPLFA